MTRKLVLIFCLGFGWHGYNQTSTDIEHTIKSEYFETDRTIQVHFPKNYSKTEHLPVVYILDAQWDAYFKLTTAIIDYLIVTNEFPRSLVVGINAENRQYELTPTPVNEDWQIPSLGGAKLLENHITNEIWPLLEHEYNPAPFKICIGHSLGGTFVLNSLVDNPSLFNAYIAISPNLQIDDEEIILKIQRHGSELSNSNKFIYTSIGTEGNTESMFLDPAKNLDSILKPYTSATLEWNFSIYQGFNHATSPLEGIHNSLLKLAEKWTISNLQKEEIASSMDVLAQFNGFYTNLSNWAGYTILPNKNDFYSFTRFLEEKTQYQDAINIYKAAIERFPTESRFYNCIAENLIKLEQKNEAKAYLQEALKVLKDESFDYRDDKIYFENLYKKNLKMTNEK